MRSVSIAATLVGGACAVAASTFAGPAHANVPASPSVRSSEYYANIVFKSPAPSDLRLTAKGPCKTPKFGWEVQTNAPQSQFDGKSSVASRGTEYGSQATYNFSVNRQQYVTVSKPVCKTGTYTIRVSGTVTSNVPGDDGYTYTPYARANNTMTYQVTGTSVGTRK